MEAIRETVQGSVRQRYDEFLDAWSRGERHLPYTILAVTFILAMGAVIVPLTLNATTVEALPKDQLLAERYVEAIAKVRGSTEPVPSVEEAMKAFGSDGGEACSKPIPALHQQLLVRPKGRASFIDRVAQQRWRVTMRVYCPARDDRYAAWLKAPARA